MLNGALWNRHMRLSLDLTITSLSKQTDRQTNKTDVTIQDTSGCQPTDDSVEREINTTLQTNILQQSPRHSQTTEQFFLYATHAEILFLLKTS